jgi:excinuclease ABC subunit B
MGNLIQAGQQAESRAYIEPQFDNTVAADPLVEMLSPELISHSIEVLRKRMTDAAKRLDFVEAAQLRDEMLRLMEKDEAPKD